MVTMKQLIIILCCALLLGCESPLPKTDLQQLQSLSRRNFHYSTGKTNTLRLEAIQETALSVAAQAALARRSKEINQTLKKNARHLDQVFNFSILLLKDNVIPPVLEQGNNTLNLASQDSLRISDRVFQIVRQAQFVTTPPTWRDYLMMNFKKPEPPDPSLVPKSRMEAEVWKKYTKMGWENGIKQADNIFLANLHRLKRDYQGIILYRKLLAQNMVSPPFVAKSDLGVTGGGDEMRINDQVLRITALPQLKPNSRQWKTPLETHKHKLTMADKRRYAK